MVTYLYMLTFSGRLFEVAKLLCLELWQNLNMLNSYNNLFVLSSQVLLLIVWHDNYNRG